MSQDDDAPARLRWARLRFSIIGPLLASPPEPGELAGRIGELAETPWRHPTTGEVLRFSAKTIERMYYAARDQADPLRALERKVPKHAGTHPSVSAALAKAIDKQYAEHPRWSYQLHHDNLVAAAKENPSLGPMPGYATVRRFMKDRGLFQNRRRRGKGSETEVVPRETRSYEVAHVNALWHFDFHEGKRQVLTASGERKTPYLFGAARRLLAAVLPRAVVPRPREHRGSDSRPQPGDSRSAGLPRAMLSDNGAPMKAAETIEGVERLGIVQYLTLPNSPEQNGKQEHFWTQVEGRLMPMLEGEPRAHPRAAQHARPRRGSSRSTTARSTASSARRRSSATSKAPTSVATARAPRRSAAPSAWRSRARSAGATAPSPWRACASRSPRPTARCAAPAPRRALGPVERRSRRPAHGRPPRDALAARQDQERRPRAPRARATPPRRRLPPDEAAGHRAAAARADGRVRRHGPAARLPAQGRHDPRRRRGGRLIV